MTIARFTLAYWCVLLAALLPFVASTIAKWGVTGSAARKAGYDPNNPRVWSARQTDWRARAIAAQQNSFEALPFFIGAVIIAHTLSVHQAQLDTLAFLFVFLRIMYIVMYVAGLGRVRSMIWTAALVVNIAILFLGYR